MMTAADRMELFGILELAVPIESATAQGGEALLEVDNQHLVGHFDGNRVRFRFCPREEKAYRFKIRSNIAALEGVEGGITVATVALERARCVSPDWPNWWTDDQSPALGQGELCGLVTVNKWRREFLSDFAERMTRCATALPDGRLRKVTMSFDHRISRRAAIATLLAGTGCAVLGTRAAWAATNAYAIPPDVIVAKDGSSHFTTVHAALQSIPKDNVERKIILVRDGVYEERVRVLAPYVTLRGESRYGTHLIANAPADTSKDEIGMGVLNIAHSAHDFIAENLTIHNTVRVTGPHAFAVLGNADRVVIQDADIYSLGADTLAMWRTSKSKEEQGRSEGPGATPLTEEGGRYYHARLRVSGSVDFICPRGWCYMTDSVVLAANQFAEAAIWHSATHPDHKFVLTNTSFDGPPRFNLGRNHRDAAFYLLGCKFSERIRDRPIYRVIYPLDGSKPKEWDIQKNRELDAENTLGPRYYYYNSHRSGGDYSWMKDNLTEAKGSPSAAEIDAKWTFGGSWDPERGAPFVQSVKSGAKGIQLTFNELVTVKGKPRLKLANGAIADYLDGSGTNTLRFARRAGAPSMLDFTTGTIVASEAITRPEQASERLPG